MARRLTERHTNLKIREYRGYTIRKNSYGAYEVYKSYSKADEKTYGSYILLRLAKKAINKMEEEKEIKEAIVKMFKEVKR